MMLNFRFVSLAWTCGHECKALFIKGLRNPFCSFGGTVKARFEWISKRCFTWSWIRVWSFWPVRCFYIIITNTADIIIHCFIGCYCDNKFIKYVILRTYSINIIYNFMPGIFYFFIYRVNSSEFNFFLWYFGCNKKKQTDYYDSQFVLLFF